MRSPLLSHLGSTSLDEWLYNGGPYQLVVFHFLLGVFAYMGREWELSYRLGYASLDLRCLFGTCRCCICCIPRLSIWTRIILRRDASRYLWHIQLSCLYSKLNTTSSFTLSICSALLVYSVVFSVLCGSLVTSSLVRETTEDCLAELWLQVWSRGRDLQHRCCSWILWSSDLPIRFLQQLPFAASLLPGCMALSLVSGSPLWVYPRWRSTSIASTSTSQSSTLRVVWLTPGQTF